MAIIDVVKWESNNTEFCHKFPSQDLRLGTTLVVNTSQTAFFVKGGVICDQFDEPGTHTIETENIPVLSKLINFVVRGGDSPFQAEVWFINKITKLDMKWGTPIPIQLEDPKYHIIVPVRAFGQYGIKVVDPRLFLETLIGNMPSFTADTIDQYFKGKLMSNLNTALAKTMIEQEVSILDISLHLLDLSDSCQKIINQYFINYGLELVDFSVISVNVPENDPSFIKLKEAKANLAQLSVAGRDFYQMQRSFDVLEKAAENEGAGGPMMGVGMGLGFGNAVGTMAGNMINTNPQPMPPPPPIPQEPTYFIYVNGQQLGNQTASTIATMRAAGTINDDTLVWAPGFASWTPIKNVPALSSQCPPPLPPNSTQI